MSLSRSKSSPSGGSGNDNSNGIDRDYSMSALLSSKARSHSRLSSVTSTRSLSALMSHSPTTSARSSVSSVIHHSSNCVSNNMNYRVRNIAVVGTGGIFILLGHTRKKPSAIVYESSVSELYRPALNTGLFGSVLHPSLEVYQSVRRSETFQ